MLLPVLHAVLPHTRTRLDTYWGALLSPGATAAAPSGSDPRSAAGANDEVRFRAPGTAISTEHALIARALRTRVQLPRGWWVSTAPDALVAAGQFPEESCECSQRFQRKGACRLQVVAERLLRELTREHVLLLAQLQAHDPPAAGGAPVLLEALSPNGKAVECATMRFGCHDSLLGAQR